MTTPSGAASPSNGKSPEVLLEDFMKQNVARSSDWTPGGRCRPAVMPQAGKMPLLPPAQAELRRALPDAEARQRVREDVRLLLEAFLSRDQPSTVAPKQEEQRGSFSLPVPTRVEVELQRLPSATMPRTEAQAQAQAQVHLRDRATGPSRTSDAAWLPPRPLSYLEAVRDSNTTSQRQRKVSDMSTSPATSQSSLEDVSNIKSPNTQLTSRKKKSLFQRARERVRMSFRRHQTASRKPSEAVHMPTKSSHESSHQCEQLQRGRSDQHRPSRHGTGNSVGSGHEQPPHAYKWRTGSGGDGNSHPTSSPGEHRAGRTAADARDAKKSAKKRDKPPVRTASITAAFERLRSSLMRKTSRATRSDEKSSKSAASDIPGIASQSHSAPISQHDKELLYMKVAERLARIADAYEYGSSMEVVESDGCPHGSTAGEEALHPAEVDQRALEERIVIALRAKVDGLAETMPPPTDAIRRMVQGVVYSEFSRVVNEVLPESQPETRQLAVLFRLTSSAIRSAGSSAMRIKDFTLRYVEDRFVHWIADDGGWDSMLEDSDFDVD